MAHSLYILPVSRSVHDPILSSLDWDSPMPTFYARDCTGLYCVGSFVFFERVPKLTTS